MKLIIKNIIIIVFLLIFLVISIPSLIYCIEPKYGLININGEEIINNKYSIINYKNITNNDKYITAFKTNIFHDIKPIYIDLLGNEYENIPFESNYYKNRGVIKDENDKFAIQDENGNLLCDYIYDDISGFEYSSLSIVKQDNKYGFINLNGDLVVDCIYNYAEIINEEYAVVFIEGKGYGMIDSTGKEILECKYDNKNIYYEDGFFYVYENNIEKILDSEKNIIYINNKYSYVYAVNNELLIAELNNGKQGLIDINDNIIIDFNYDNISNYYDFPFLVIDDIDGKSGCFDYEGNKIIDFDYQELTPYNETYIMFKKDNKYGLMDLNENIIINNKYDIMMKSTENDNTIVVELNNKQGLIDLKGNELIKCKYDILIPVNNEIVMISAINQNQSYLFILIIISYIIIIILILKKILKIKK